MTQGEARSNDGAAAVDSRRVSPLGARASNAGDQYQELWALQQALGLLEPSTGLTSVTVEGVTSETADEDQRRWDGVDCALYFGGNSVETANRIVIAQHKYSTTNPEDDWTIARLVSSKSKKVNNSVVRRLADAFSATSQRMKSDGGLEIRLVSNQGIAAEVTDVISALVNNSHTEGDQKLTSNIEKVRNAAGLTESELIAFAKSLDLSECGKSSRQSLRGSITHHVASLLGEDEGASVRELLSFIRDLMMPEKARDFISRETILGWFGVAAETGLFPAPSEFKTVSNPIEREPARELLKTLESGCRITCLHGSAGCGKTTTLTQLQGLLPPSSVLALFDCYGGGRYLFTTDRRHLPEHAFTQIANQLSLNLGVPFLLARGSRNPLLVTRFLSRVKLAAELLHKVDPNALLVVGVDAADNSVTAALRQNPAEACFVTELSQADLTMLPPNVRLVFSARTARKESLRLPNSTSYVECPAFSLEETEALAKRVLPVVSNDWIAQFHALSRGIPRVQDYAIRAGNNDPNATLNALRPGGKNLNDVLRKLFQEAAEKSGTSYDFLMSCLAALPAPIPLQHLSSVSQLQQSEIIDFLQDTSPSLRLEEEGISIADEDVEDFIREEGANQLAQAYQRACDYFAPIYASDQYAAVNYADLLVAAGREQQVLPMLEQNLSPAAIADPIVRREIQLRRLRLAHAACRAAGDSAATMKVVLLGAEASKDEAFFGEILDKHPDLSTRFARSSLVRLVLSDADSARKQGRILVQDALRFARSGDWIQTREQLHYYEEWLARRNRAPAEERRSWTIETDDIVAYSECVVLLDGPVEAFEDLKRWRSRSLRLSVGLRLVLRLIAHGNAELVQRAVEERALPRMWDILLLVPLALSSTKIDVSKLERSLKGLRRAFQRSLNSDHSRDHDDAWKSELRGLMVTACEIGYSLGMPEATVRDILTLTADLKAPEGRFYDETETGSLDILIRAWLLRQTVDGLPDSAEAFLNAIDPPEPPKPAPSKKVQRKKKRSAASQEGSTTRRKLDEEQRRIIKTVFPVYASRVPILTYHRQNGSVGEEQVEGIAGFGSDEYLLKRYGGTGPRRRTASSVLNLMHLSGLPWEPLFAKAASLASGGYSDPFGHHLLPLWRFLLLRIDSRDFVLKSLVERSPVIRTEKEPATSKVEAVVAFSRLALIFSEPDARSFYEEAVSLAQEIDREAIDQIGVLESLTGHFAHWNANERREASPKVVNVLTEIAVRLRDQEGFPWEDCINSLVRLHAPTALAAVSRWSDQGIQDYAPSLRHFLAETGRLNLISPAIVAAVSMLDIHIPNQVRLDTVRRLAGGSDALSQSIVDLLAADILRNEGPTLVSKEAAELIETATASSVRCSGNNYQRLVRTHQYLKQKKQTEAQTTEKKDKVPELKGATFTTAATIEAEYASARESGGYFDPGPFLLKMIDTVTSLGDRVAFLDALSAADIASYNERARFEVILAALSRWDSPSVNQWRSQKLPRVIVERFLGLTRYYGWSYHHFEDVLAATQLGGADKLAVLAEGLEKTTLSLDSRSLFMVCEEMAALLTPAEAWTIFEWYLHRLSGRTPLDESALKLADVPKDQEEGLARFLLSLMSDIDTRIRWRAAHATRRLAKLGQANILNAIFAQYERTRDDAFRDPVSPFYWLAARLWVVISAARIANESPASLRGVHSKLVQIATDNTFPHLLVRENAKATLLTLREKGELVLDDTTQKAIAAINASPFPPDKRREDNATRLKWDERKGERFDFGLDTVEHVLSPLLRMFVGLSKDELFQRIEHWLVDEWKAPAKVHYWDSEPRKGRYDDRKWGLYHSDKGSMPILERHGYYLEWNAVQCVVGELIAKYPLRVPDDDYWGTFQHWFSKMLLTFPPVWLADLRDPKPLEDQYWLEGSANEKQWISRISRKDFFAALFGGDGSNKAVINVDASWTSAFQTREVRATLSSALVNPDTAGALIRSLITRDRRQWPYHLPDEDSDHGYDERFREMPYKLVGWLVDVRHDDGFDIKDTLRNGLKGQTKSPGSGAIAQLKLQPLPLPSKEWKAEDSGNVAVREINWSDLPERYDDDGSSYRQRETKSEGSILQIDADMLMSFLNQQKMSLIVSIHFERRLENEYGGRYDDKTKKVKTFDQFFILRTDGTIEDSQGVVGTWWKAR